MQSLFCLSAFQPHDVILITYDVATLTGFRHDSVKRVYFVRYLGSTGIRVFLMLLLSFVTFYRVFRKERPDFLFSTGSEIAIPAFLLGKALFGCRLIFLESLTRVESPSLTAKILYYVADLFLVQSEALLAFFGKRALYKGSLI